MAERKKSPCANRGGGAARLSPDNWKCNTRPEIGQETHKELKTGLKRLLPWWARGLGRRLAQRVYDALKLARL